MNGVNFFTEFLFLPRCGRHDFRIPSSKFPLRFGTRSVEQSLGIMKLPIRKCQGIAKGCAHEAERDK